MQDDTQKMRSSGKSGWHSDFRPAHENQHYSRYNIIPTQQLFYNDFDKQNWLTIIIGIKVH